VDCERRGLPRFWLADIHEKRGAQPLGQLRGNDVRGLRAAPDPLTQMIEIRFVVHDDLVRARGGLVVEMRSPIPGTAP
jgi:hypothetical protein